MPSCIHMLGYNPSASAWQPRWRGVQHWKPALQVFQILVAEERVPISA
jgi:hypothetical protein